MSPYNRLSVSLCLSGLVLLVSQAIAAPAPTPNVTYSPSVQVIEGNQPLIAGSPQQIGVNPYTLTITGPGSLPAGSTWPVTINLVVEIAVDAYLRPIVPEGVSLSDALGFVTLSEASLTFTGSNQNRSTVVSVNVPLGDYAGNYTWRIRGQGWPSGVGDPKATINATILPPPTVDTTVPVITNLLPVDGSVFVYNPPTTGPISFPISFDATVAAGGSAISAMSATIDGIPFNGVSRYSNGEMLEQLAVTGINTLAASGSVQSPNITDPGPHTIAVSATNNVGTTVATTRINIHSPPQITSAATTTFTYRTPGTFTVTSTGFPTPTYQISGPLPAGVSFDAQTGVLSGTPTTAAGSPVSLTITASNGVGTPATQNFTLVLNKAPLTITAASASKVYGASLPALSATYSGFVAGEDSSVLGGALTLTTTANTSSNVGSYAIVPGGYTSDNYAITYVNGALSVTPASLTVTAAPATKVYGALMPGFSATYSGLVLSQDPSVLGGALSFTSTATVGSPVGANYSVTPGGLTSSNYAISFVAGNLTITRAPLTITADNKSMAAGSAVPALTASYSGLVNGDTSSVVTGLGFATSATSASPAGSYPITLSGGSAANYTITLVNGTLTVNASGANQTISGFVFLDANLNGIRNAATEAGLGGIEVKLYKGSSVQATTTTELNGSFSFTNIPTDTYEIDAIEPIGLTPTVATAPKVSPTHGWSADIGLALNFRAIQGLKADGFTIGYWKNNIDKAIAGKTGGTQVSAEAIDLYTDLIETLALSLWDILDKTAASAVLSSNSNQPVDLLKKQLLASEYNYANHGYIGGSAALTYAFISWGESIAVNSASYPASYVTWAKDWFDAYNNSHGGLVTGPNP